VQYLSAAQLVCAIVAAADGGQAAVLSAAMATLRVVMEGSGIEDEDILEAAKALLEEWVVPTSWSKEIFDDCVAALTQGVMPSSIPTWLAGPLVIFGKVLGLSVSVGLTTSLIPQHIFDWCRTAHITPGDLLNSVMLAVTDLLERCADAWAEADVSALWRTKSTAPPIRAALRLLQTNPERVPGSGSGLELIVSRLGHMRNVLQEAEGAEKRMPYGPERGAAARITTELEAHLTRCAQIYYGPTGRVRPVNAFIFGPVGTGKSTVIELWHRSVATVTGVTFDQASHFPRNAADEYWDGYDDIRHQFVTVDELGQSADASSNVYEDLVKVMGEAAHAPKMADMVMKNQTFMRQVSTAVGSNLHDAGVHDKVTCESAFWRRFAVRVHVHAHETVRKSKESAEIDDKVLAVAGPHTVLWLGTVERPVVQLGGVVK
jgi:hypothetical protein